MPKFCDWLFNQSCDDVGMSLKMDLTNKAGHVWDRQMFALANEQAEAFKAGGGVKRWRPLRTRIDI